MTFRNTEYFHKNSATISNGFKDFKMILNVDQSFDHRFQKIGVEYISEQSWIQTLDF